MGYPAYQCVKLSDRTVYCSKKKFKNHDEGAEWVSALQKAKGFKGNEIKGKPYTSSSQPSDAEIYP